MNHPQRSFLNASLNIGPHDSENELLRHDPQLRHPRISRRSLLALGSALAFDLAGCGVVVTTLAGSAGSTGDTNATGTAAQFSSPTGVAVDACGAVYVADSGNHMIRKIS